MGYVFNIGIGTMVATLLIDTFYSYRAGYGYIAALNILCLVLSAIPLGYSFFNKHKRVLAINIVLYLFLADVLLSNVYYSRIGIPGYTAVFFRDMIFSFVLMITAGFSGRRINALVFGFISIVYIILTGFISGDIFIRSNSAVVAVIFLAVAFGVYLYIGSLERVTLEKMKYRFQLEEQRNDLKNALYSISKDLEMAARVQSAVFSRDFSHFDPDRLAVYSMPMIDIGGDIVDVQEVRENRYRIFIADANGHGIQAALVTMLIKNEYDRIKTDECTPDVIMDRLNAVFMGKKFCAETIFSGFIADVDCSAYNIEYASAGHPAQYLLSGGKILNLKKNGPLIGVIKEAEYEYGTASFSRGDSLILFTDGIFEVYSDSGAQLKEKQIRETVLANSTENSTVILNSILEKMNSFRGVTPVRDDVTLLVCRNFCGGTGV